MTSIALQTIDDWQNLRSTSTATPHGVIILKFSPRCPISRSAEREFDAWVRELPDDAGVVCVKVDVVNSRPLSQYLAQELRVRHESPQAILVAAGANVHWHASHYAITKQALTAAIEDLCRPKPM